VLVRRIAVHTVPEPDELPEGEREVAWAALDRIRASIGRDRRAWLELAEGGGVDLGVAWFRGLGLVVVDPGGEPLPVQGARIETASELLDRLCHLARFAGVRALANRDLSSSLRDALELELRHRGSGKSGEALEPVPLRPEDGVPCGDEVELAIRNRSDFDLEIAVLDIQPDWGVSQVHPAGGGAVTVGPNEETVARLVVDLPFEGEEGRDLLKVIATREPVDFSWLCLPALDGSGATRRRSGTGARPSGSLEALFAGLTADRPATRSGHPEVPPGDDWAVADVELRVVRSRTGAAALHAPNG
jgi:hypothetical protein